VDLTSLAQLIPSSSRLVLDQGNKPDQTENTAVEDVIVPTAVVREGDLVRVLPGERIPTDGTVVNGKCSVDESMLTGETRCEARHQGEWRLHLCLAVLHLANAQFPRNVT
jgi:P-type E1-E2 ATPase